MGLRATQRKLCAEALVRAAQTRTPLDPFSAELGEMTTHDAYRIQHETLRARRRAGDRRIGWKVGLTSAATRAEIGIDEPIAGYLLASAVWTDGDDVDLRSFIAPGVEPEIAVVMARELTGPGITALDVLRAVDGVTVALEVVDSRFRDWKGDVRDAVADNAFAAGLVLAGALQPPRAHDLRLEGVVVEHNGRVAATAAGAAALGHPAAAVAWLANRLAAFAVGLKTGDVVLTGSLTAILRPHPGDTVRAAFTRLGSVSLRLR
jgi:2-keto-4-pentenoate hydratase